MLHGRFCLVCDERLAQASNAMRRHESTMAQAGELFRKGKVTEEIRLDFGARIIASLQEAQTAWDVYRHHLDEHGLSPNCK